MDECVVVWIRNWLVGLWWIVWSWEIDGRLNGE